MMETYIKTLTLIGSNLCACLCRCSGYCVYIKENTHKHVIVHLSFNHFISEMYCEYKMLHII